MLTSFWPTPRPPAAQWNRTWCHLVFTGAALLFLVVFGAAHTVYHSVQKNAVGTPLLFKCADCSAWVAGSSCGQCRGRLLQPVAWQAT